MFNKRTDKYGGDLRGRLRFACEIVQEIKKTCGADFPVVLRFSIKSYIKALRQGAVPGESFQELGRDIGEAREAIPILEEAGYDAFDCDAGTYDSWYWAHPPMYFGKGMYLSLVKEVRDCFTKPVLVAGRMDNIQMAVDAVNSHLIDGVGLGRPLLSDPDYCNKVRSGHPVQIRPCLGCHDGCFGRLLQSGLGSCAVNPECGREDTVGIRKAEQKKKVVVIGGGLVGCELSLHLAQNGKKVTIVEALPDILKSGSPMPPMNEWMLRDLLTFNQVEIVAGAKVTAIAPDGLTYEKDGEVKTLSGDQVVLSIGYRSTHSLFDELKYDYAEIYNLGDSRQVRNIRGAIWDAYEVARSL